MIKSYKPMLIISMIMLISGYTAFYFCYDITYANAFFAGFIIILIDLLLLARYLKRAVKQATVTGFLLQSFTRWVFIGVCIYITCSAAFIQMVICTGYNTSFCGSFYYWNISNLSGERRWNILLI